MNKWWQDPRLDDEGTYDYLAEPLPNDYAKWDLSKERWKCSECGKFSRLLLNSAHYFYCYDGWDCMDYSMCWKCYLRGKIAEVKWKMKRQRMVIKNTITLWKLCKKGGIIRWYKLARKLNTEI